MSRSSRAIVVGFCLSLLLVVALAFAATAADSPGSSDRRVDDCAQSLACGTSHSPLAVCSNACGHPHLVPLVVIFAGLMVVAIALILASSSGRTMVLARSGRRLDRPPQLLV